MHFNCIIVANGILLEIWRQFSETILYSWAKVKHFKSWTFEIHILKLVVCLQSVTNFKCKWSIVQRWSENKPEKLLKPAWFSILRKKVGLKILNSRIILKTVTNLYCSNSYAYTKSIYPSLFVHMLLTNWLSYPKINSCKFIPLKIIKRLQLCYRSSNLEMTSRWYELTCRHIELTRYEGARRYYKQTPRE